MNSIPFRKALIVAGIAATLGFSVSGCDDRSDADALQAGISQNMTDSEITDGIKTQLALRSELDASDISVETRNGVVTLTGSVRDSGARSAAESATRAFEGVTQVSNRITVVAAQRMEDVRSSNDAVLVATNEDSTRNSPDRSTTAENGMDKAGQAVSDTWITTKVKSALLADSDASGLEVKVDTVNGVVTLEGGLTTQAEVDLVKRLAADVEGVRRVNATALIVARR